MRQIFDMGQFLADRHRLTVRDANQPPIFPRGILIGAGTLVAFAILIAGTSRVSHQSHVDMPPTYAVAQRDLKFADLSNGGIDVTDAKTGVLITTVQPQTGGFLRGIMRGLVRDHRLQDKAAGSSFHLTQWADGRLSIEDPATHEAYELEAFGSTNEAVFAKFLGGRPQVGAATTGTATGADR